jgi:hypothetical protein
MDPLQPKRRGRGKNAAALPTSPGGESAGRAGGVSEFTQLALWMAASLAGMVTALLIARRPFFESLMQSAGGGAGAKGRYGTAGRPARRKALPFRPTGEESLPMLAEAIVGNSKEAVASVFGPPRSAAVRGSVKSAGKAPAFWQATTWYYPLPRKDALAMAIEFDQDAARRVEFFRAPGL